VIAFSFIFALLLICLTLKVIRIGCKNCHSDSDKK